VAAKILRIFVSSPSDVAPERERVKLVADRLNGELEGLVRLEILRWEDAFYTAAHSFQEAIDSAIGNMSATDMVVCIVWKRAGLRLNPAIWRRADGSAYESGTVLEVETAVEVSRKHSGVPDVYLFRKTADVLYRADRATEEMEQHQLLEAIWRRWTESAEGYNTAGFQTFNDQDDFEDKLEACLRQWLERRGVVVRGPVWDRKLKGSPFRGLAPFDAAHAPVFFGRDATIARAIAKLRRASFLLIIGASGSGKSSLLRAGLVPRVTAPGVIPNVDQWRTAIVVPADDPLVNLADALFADDALGAELRAGDFSTPRLLAKLFEAGGDAALAPVRAALRRASESRAAALRYDEPRPTRLLIAVDQVERLFVEAQAARADAFAGLLRDLVAGGLASVVAVLRSDGYGRFQAIEPFLALLEAHGSTLDLLPPSPAELEDIVTRPVAACHPPLAYDTNDDGQTLAERLVTDARGGDALPLLQMTLQRLFDAEELRGDGVLRFRDYPGMDAAVTRTAEEAVADLDPRSLAALPALITAFVHDVTFSPDGRLEAMSIVPVVRASFERGDRARIALVDQFIARRLLTAEDADGVVRVRPVHEAFLRVQPKAIAIIKENASLIRVRGTLEPMAAEWSRAPAASRDDFLATSPALIAGMAQLNDRFGDDLAPELRDFIAASLAADTRRRNVERNRQRRIIAATAAGLLIALVLAGFAGLQWREANTERIRAQIALRAATETAETLVYDLAREFENRPGMPVALKREILERVQTLQRYLAQAGTTADLRRLEAISLMELSTTHREQRRQGESVAAAEHALAIITALIKEFPQLARLRRDHAIILNALGDAQQSNGQWESAIKSHREALAILDVLLASATENLRWQRDRYYTLGKIADVQAVTGQREEALKTYRESRALIEALASTTPNDRGLQTDLAFTLNREAILLAAEGKSEAALAAYRTGLTIRERLAAAEPDNTERRRVVFVTLNRIAEVLEGLGRQQEAVATFAKAHKIIEDLAASDMGNLQWQYDLSRIAHQFGQLLLAAGDAQAGLGKLQQSLAIREKLAPAQGDDSAWQRETAVLLNRIGDARMSLGKIVEALAVYRDALAISEGLVKRQGDNIEWNRDLAYTLVKVGIALAAQDQNDALGLFQRAADIRRAVAARAPSDAQFKRELAFTYGLIGETHLAAKRGEQAREAFLAANAVIEDYAAANPDNTQWQIDLVVNLFKLATLKDSPLDRYTRALAILRRLDTQDRLGGEQKSWIVLLEKAIAELKQ
jgi:tetratricopeptide (TPR) repeat protein